MLRWLLGNKKQEDSGLQLHFNAARLQDDVNAVQRLPNTTAGLDTANYTGVMQVFNSNGDVVNVTDIVPANDPRLASGELGAHTYVDTVQQVHIARDKYGRALI